MNYLILTPDGVGSTILQRLITMTLYLENCDVSNTHELTNGITLKNKVAIKDFTLGYSQSLTEIRSIIEDSHTHTSLVSRLAKYHLDVRKDHADDCKNFYKFLNEHFEKKIMCVRENIFEYAMSWSIRDQSGVLNVYNTQDKEKVLQVSKVNEKFFINKCKEYIDYIQWIDEHFPNVEKISYEKLVQKSDEMMEKVTGYRNTFIDKIGRPLKFILFDEHNFLRNRKESKLSNDGAKALVKYRIVCKEIFDRKISLAVPFKNNTLAEKKNQIKNFDSCLNKFYDFAKNHNWIDQSIATYDFWNEKHL